MAKKYIDAEAAFKVMRDISNHYHETYVSNARAETAEWCLKKLEELPAADVAPVVHAHWVWPETKRDRPFCSNCLNDAFWENDHGFVTENFCPNCGAKMDEENNE